MKKRTLIAVLGIWIAILPFLGLPSSWKSRLIIVSGLAVALLAVSRKKASGTAVISPAATSSVQGSDTQIASVIKKPRKPRMPKAEQSYSQVPEISPVEISPSASVSSSADDTSN